MAERQSEVSEAVSKLALKLSLEYMRTAGIPGIQVEVPMNMCPDDDPPGERPMKKVWVMDTKAVFGSIATAVLEEYVSKAEVEGRKIATEKTRREAY